MAKTKIALVALLAACGSISLVGCSSQNHSGSNDESGEVTELQEVGFNLKTNNGEVTSVDYRVLSSTGAVVDQGTFQTPDPSDNFKAQLFLRVGTGYRIELSGTANTGTPSAPQTSPCSGNQTFNVASGQTTQVAVALVCVASGVSAAVDKGSAVVNATLQITRTPAGECGISQATVGPLSQVVGSDITLSSTLVGTGAAGTWSATGLNGSFVAATATSTTFKCLGPSAGSITLSVTGANGCTDSVSAAVTCVAGTAPAVCGNGLVEAPEVCDDGDILATGACNATCTGPGMAPVVCGDGIVNQSTEVCDDGNTVNTDTCDNNCQPVVVVIACGDGTVNGSDQCDDSNTVSNDGCSATCQIERCGDGIVQTDPSRPEACDDGNSVNTDTCSNTCQVVVVGPTIVCGDGTVAGTEQCDDGNTANGDHCTSACLDGRDCGTCLAADAAVGSYQTSLCDTDPLCLAIQRCVATTGCFTGRGGDPTQCFCGTTPGDCYAPSYTANGACKAEMATASGVTNPTNGDVLDRMFDFNNAPPLGAAWLILANATTTCTAECKL